MKLVPLYREVVKQVQEEENKKEHPYDIPFLSMIH